MVVSIPDLCLLLYFEQKAICSMYLRVSKDLHEPAHTCSLIDASAYPSIIALYVILVCCVFDCTVLSAKSDSDFMFCLQSSQG